MDGGTAAAARQLNVKKAKKGLAEQLGKPLLQVLAGEIVAIPWRRPKKSILTWFVVVMSGLKAEVRC